MQDVQKVLYKYLPLKVLLLKGRDGQTWKDHVHYCVPCHFSNMDGQIGPS
jgi:hypothetical protein